MIKKEDYDKFIFKGSLALEAYFDNTNKNKTLFDKFNVKLKKYRSLDTKTDNDKELIANELLSLLKKIGIKKFIIYDDGDIEYIIGKEHFVKDSNLDKIILILDSLLNNNNIYLEDYSLINELKDKLKSLNSCNSLEEIDYIKEKIYYLEEKYSDIFDLGYYFDPLYIRIKNNIHKKEVKNIRTNLREKKEGNKNG